MEVELVGLEASSNGRSCTLHSVCGKSVLTESVSGLSVSPKQGMSTRMLTDAYLLKKLVCATAIDIAARAILTRHRVPIQNALEQTQLLPTMP